MSTSKPTKVPVVPKFFKGTPEEDSEKYIIQFERAAQCNNWDDDAKKRYLPVYLEGTAQLWFQDWSREHNIASTTWASFVDTFKYAFLSVAKVDVAERKLYSRKQKLGESAEDYLYEMLDLCHAVDEKMPEAKIVRYIVKGLIPTFLRKSQYLRPQNNS